MNDKIYTLTIFTCIALLAIQSLFIFIPLAAVPVFNLAFKPLAYSVLAVAVFLVAGADKRPIPKAYTANLVAIISIAMLGIVLLVIVVVFGASRNAMTPNMIVFLRNLWERGSVILLGEYIRFTLIKNTNFRNRTVIIIALTVVLAYSNIYAVRMLVEGSAIAWDLFFESAFRVLMISVMASCFAITGSLLSVVLTSFVYAMIPYLLPVLPNTTTLIFSLIISGMSFLTAVIYLLVSDDKKRGQRLREKRAVQYIRKPLFGYLIMALLIGNIAAFFIGSFNVYPIAVLTGSMSGTFERGSLVIIEKVPPGEAYVRVREGDIIHYINHRGVLYVHRVVDFRYDINGERVYITKGDAGDVVDPYPVSQDNVLGIVRATIPYLGYPYIYFHGITW
jgi:signal peptidase